MILAKNILISLKFLRERKKTAPIDKKTPIYIYAHANYFIYLLNQKLKFFKNRFQFAEVIPLKVDIYWRIWIFVYIFRSRERFWEYQ